MNGNGCTKIRGNFFQCSIATALGLIICTHAQAEPFSDWQWGGFVSQSGVYTSDNSFFGSKSDDHVSGEFSETAIIATGPLFPKVDLATHLISQRAGDMDDGAPRIDHLHLLFHVNDSMNSSHALKLGRFKTPLGFYNETRDVPFTRPSIFLPQGAYWERVRNMRSFINGGQYMFDYRANNGDLSLRASYGKLKVDQSEFDAQAGTDSAGTLDPGNLNNIALFYDHDGGRMRVGFSRMFTKQVFEPYSTSLINPDGSLNVYTKTADTDFSVNILSFEYSGQHWTLTGEYMRGKTETEPFSDFFPALIDYPEAAYLQLSYRMENAVEFFVRYDSLQNNRKDPRGEKFAQSLKNVVEGFGLDPADFPITPPYARYAFDKTIGVSWRPQPNFLLRGEWHRVTGTSWIASYGLNSKPLAKEWDLVAIQLSYRFK